MPEIIYNILIAIFVSILVMVCGAACAILTLVAYLIVMPSSYLQIMLHTLVSQSPIASAHDETPGPTGVAEPPVPGTVEPATPADQRTEAPVALPGATALREHDRSSAGKAPRPSDDATSDDGQDGDQPAAEESPSLSDVFAPWRGEIGQPPEPGHRQMAWLGHHIDGEVAMPSYFFGPLGDDLIYTVNAAFSHSFTIIDYALSLARKASATDNFFGVACGAGIRLGNFLGIPIGAVALVGVAVINLTVGLFAIVLSFCFCAVIRGVDIARRFVGEITLVCPSCSTAVRPYPVYLCPRCGNKNRDIRPGRHGITTRICRECRAHLPTSLALGSARLAAECPRCSSRLPGKFGDSPQILIPFLGAMNVGKTQLMYMLVRMLCELVEASSGTVSLEEDSQDRLDQIALDLQHRNAPSKTTAEQPAGYVLRVRLGLAERLFYIFDAAGEMHYSRDRLNDLAYLDKARSMVFVVDPLAADSVWSQLSPERQHALSSVRSRMTDSDLAYQQSSEQMRWLGIKPAATRLAFVVSKSDLLPQSDHLPSSNMEIQHWVADHKGLDMSNIVRDSIRRFADVRFFRTAAVETTDGLPDTSIAELARWLLKSAGIVLDGTGRGA